MRAGWLALLLAACTPAQAPAIRPDDAPPPGAPAAPTPRRAGRPPTPLERGVIDRLARDAERIRGLRFVRYLDVEIQGARAIAAHLDAELDDEDLERARRVYTALDLLPEGIDLRALLREVMGEQVLGFYDTDRQLLVVRQDVARDLLRAPSSPRAAEARAVLLHELVHALQDQRLGFGRLLDAERDSDADNALKALAEGDASLAMIFYTAEQVHQTPEELLASGAVDAMVRELSAPAGEGALGRAPAILRVTLVVPYLAGLGFAHRLYESGGWGEVDRAFAAPPTSSEQVLHPRAYLRRENPDAITIGPLPELDAAGWSAVEEDTLGELELAVFLARGVGDAAGRRAARGWGGDRLRVYERDGHGAAIWYTTWDDEDDAREAAAAARMDPHQRVERRGRAVLVLRGLPASLQEPAVADFERFAAGLAARPPRAPSTVAP